MRGLLLVLPRRSAREHRGEKRADASTLIQIPRAVVSATVQKMSMDPALSDSKLLRRVHAA